MGWNFLVSYGSKKWLYSDFHWRMLHLAFIYVVFKERLVRKLIALCLPYKQLTGSTDLKNLGKMEYRYLGGNKDDPSASLN